MSQENLKALMEILRAQESDDTNWWERIRMAWKRRIK